MTDNLDELARTVHELVTETASRQISREIAHLAEIDVDSHGVHAVSPPEGYRAPSSGVITTHVVARSRDVPEASTEMRVAVWVAQPGADVPDVLLTRADSDRSLGLDADAIAPEPTPHLHGQINDFVALIIAHMVSELNAAMQRTYMREPGANAAEYDAD
jgi:hypothetical protein